MKKLILPYLYIGSFLLLTWWVWFGLEMPGAHSNDFLSKLYLSKTLIIANLLGTLGTLFLIFSITNLLFLVQRKNGLFYLCQFSLLAGLMAYFAVQFGETFVWPTLALEKPSLLNMDGPLIKPGTLFFMANVTAGLMATLGIILFSYIMVKNFHQSKLLGVIYALSFIVFMIGMHPFVRTAGFALWLPVQIILFHRINNDSGT